MHIRFIFRELLDSADRARVLALAGFSLVIGLLEALILVLLIRSALLLTESRSNGSTPQIDLPGGFSFSVTQSLVLAAVAGAVVALGHAADLRLERWPLGQRPGERPTPSDPRVFVSHLGAPVGRARRQSPRDDQRPRGPDLGSRPRAGDVHLIRPQPGGLDRGRPVGRSGDHLGRDGGGWAALPGPPTDREDHPEPRQHIRQREHLVWRRNSPVGRDEHGATGLRRRANRGRAPHSADRPIVTALEADAKGQPARRLPLP